MPNDWVAALAATPLLCRSAAHALGTGAAVCLAVAQLLARTLARRGFGPPALPRRHRPLHRLARTFGSTNPTCGLS